MAREHTMNDKPSARIFDANWNRASEGIRVVEDFVRFAVNNGPLAARLKQWRHDLAAACQIILPTTDRFAARDTQGDVGTRHTTDSEALRPSTTALVSANLQRGQEAVRCLEEVAKVLGHSATALESLRYQLYDLQTAVMASFARPAQISDARLYVLVQCGSSLATFRDYCRDLLAAGADVLQLRDKRATDRQLLQWAETLVDCCRTSGKLAIVNDRVDIAAISDADGVHVGQDEIDLRSARRILGHNKLIGLSTHTPEQLTEATTLGADYIGCGPTFPSHTKRFDDYAGLPYLQHVAQMAATNETTPPAFAIGGIRRENLPEVLATGIHRIAVADAIHSASSPADETARLKQTLQHA